LSENENFGARAFDQTHDEAPAHFRDNHPEDQFEGASGVLFEQAMAQTRMAICLCDPNQPDVPIIFANRAFRELTGYSEDEVVGRNCRFLQGPDTRPEVVERLRHAIDNEEVIVVEIRNYKKDGTPFWNALHIGPIYDTEGNLIYFFGSQWDVSDVYAARAEQQHATKLARELSHRMKNIIAVISSVAKLVGRERGDPDTAREINDRISSLGRIYDATLETAKDDAIDLKAAIDSVLDVHRTEQARLTAEGPDVLIPFSIVSMLAIVLHELVVMSSEHGCLSRGEGAARLDWEAPADEDGIVCLKWHDSFSEAWSGEGGKAGTLIMQRMVNAAGGSIAVEPTGEGDDVRVVVCLPMVKD